MKLFLKILILLLVAFSANIFAEVLYPDSIQLNDLLAVYADTNTNVVAQESLGFFVPLATDPPAKKLSWFQYNMSTIVSVLLGCVVLSATWALGFFTYIHSKLKFFKK